MVLQQTTLSVRLSHCSRDAARAAADGTAGVFTPIVCILSFRRNYAHFSMLCITFSIHQTLRVFCC